jgi:predicted TPR repeat methyltransferase
VLVNPDPSRPVSAAIESCRICESNDIETVLDLGVQPFANSLRRDQADRIGAAPLVLCRCRHCGTIQLTETASPEVLFSEYVWVTGTSQGARDYSARFRDQLVARSRPGPLFVVEVASNDGTFLQRFQESGHRVLGIDPAKNIAAIAEQNGVPTIADFFDLTVASRIVADSGHADIAIARNVIPHVANANGVVAGMAHCLADEGVGAIEFHRADIILEELHYDSIYHEHLFYHSLNSLGMLLARHGLLPFDVTESPISGGSLVVYFSKTARPRSAALESMLAHEARLGIAQAEPWRVFAARSAAHREKLRALIESKVAAGKRVIGYGASARSSTMLNYCGIDHRHLAAVADGNPIKHGLLTPGTDIRIVAPADAFALKPDVVLLLAWNFKDEILAGMTTTYGWHGEAIVPLPGDPTELTV